MASTSPEPVFDDGSDVEVVTPVEDPPRNGVWVDMEPSSVPITDAEAELGRYMGEAIDPDDDEDDGSAAAEWLRAVVEAERDGR
jgi:hypothetical protein